MAKGDEVEKLEPELQSMKSEGKRLQNTLTNATSGYRAFVKKYTEKSECALTKAKEMKREVSEGVGKTASNGAFVLVLVDGSSHRFCNELLQELHARGTKAASLLYDVVSDEIAVILPKLARNKYSLVIRIFASLQDLSKDAAAQKLVGGNFHSIAPFFTGFTKARPFFDVVDAGDVSDVEQKICQNFKLYMANEHCKHVFFAASGSPQYLQILQPYRTQAKKVTLVAGFNIEEEFRKLSLHVVTFPRVFMTSRNQENVITNKKLNDINKLETVAEPPLFSSLLPACYIGGRVPLNSAKQRIDIYVSPPSAKEVAIYDARTKVKRQLCVNYFLRNQCQREDCGYYHGTLDPESYHVLQHRVLTTSCVKGALCRASNCPYAHICQRDQCGGRARKKIEECHLPWGSEQRPDRSNARKCQNCTLTKMRLHHHPQCVQSWDLVKE
ncbi:hypothetical protein EJ02DRAFT_431710 [Clathrospora elynae]|uniref:C3H1-type domain-containing protein n=1 Tax=Clathrospora elynae TaxID=706981 RepID=A0A6A5T060_9PLEO|nr:hypothetical protein EJ02DRAFT_431710 [Clathrospora elynae]